jgi:O-antigen ligase
MTRLKTHVRASVSTSEPVEPAAAAPDLPPRAGRFAVAGSASRTVVWLTAVLLLLVVCASLLRPDSPLPGSLRLGLVALGALTVVHPLGGLLVLAGLGPLTAMIGALAGADVRGTQLLEGTVLVFLLGWTVRSGVHGRATPVPPGAGAAVVLAVLILGSIGVQLGLHQLQTGGWALLATDVWRFLSQDYFLDLRSYPMVRAGALLLEGLGLLLAAAATCAARPDAARRLLVMTVAGACAAALLNVNRLLTISLRHAEPWQAAGEYLSWYRVNVHFADVNAAGSWLALCLVPAGVLALNPGRQRAIWVAVAALLATALWLTGSRVAMLSAVAAFVLVAGQARLRAHNSPRRVAAAAGLAAAILLAASLLVGLTPRIHSAPVSTAVQIRLELARSSLRMVAEDPLFGVGIGQFYERSLHYISPELLAIFPQPRENAHNNFLQILAELGVLGLLAFAAVLGGVLLSIRRALQAEGDPLLLGAAGGVLAFLISALAGHPLLTPEAAFPFWTLAGLAAGLAMRVRAAEGREAMEPAPFSAGLAALWRPAWILAVLVLIASIPLRGWQERRQAQVDHLEYGLSGWQIDAEGAEFRQAAAAAFFHVDASRRGLVFPVRADPAGGAPLELELALDGRTINRVPLPADRWFTVQLLLPEEPGARRSRRIDLRVVGAEGVDAGFRIGRITVSP